MENLIPPPISPTELVTNIPEYRDRKTVLVVFGIIEIILGGFAAMGIPFLFLGMFLSRKTMGGGLPWGNYVNSAVSYGFVAAVMVVLGIGCIRAQRWARDLTLVLSWIWIVLGILVTIGITVALPSGVLAGMKAAAASTPNARPLPPGFMAVILTVMIAFLAVFAIVLPIIFLVFFRRKDVQETCRRYDPHPRWTERCPLPVLALSLVFAVGAAYSLLISITTPMFPFWGQYLVGLPASGACIMVAALDIYLAIAFFRLQIAGWWIAVAGLMLRTSSITLTSLRGNLFQAYSRMGWSQQQLQTMQANPMLRSRVMLWSGVVAALLLLGYLIWLRRFFGRTAETGPREAGNSESAPPIG